MAPPLQTQLSMELAGQSMVNDAGVLTSEDLHRLERCSVKGKASTARLRFVSCFFLDEPSELAVH